MLVAGCYCKKSKCLKKYCECFKKGSPCLFNCQCEGCRNPYGVPAERETAALTLVHQSSTSEQITDLQINSPSISPPPSHLMLDTLTDLDFLFCDEDPDEPESPFKRIRPATQADAETQTDTSILMLTHTVGLGHLDVEFK